MNRAWRTFASLIRIIWAELSLDVQWSARARWGEKQASAVEFSKFLTGTVRSDVRIVATRFVPAVRVADNE